ncbi:MAG: UPF0276 protein [Planctomycetaceae bacterium]|nr:MAG: UPF0276 protein [Planctomycetaceae bacterium]
MILPRLGLPHLGFGMGLRTVHFRDILHTQPPVDWFEAITENYLNVSGRPRAVLKAVAERYPVVLHGVSLSLGSTDPLNLEYLRQVKVLAEELHAVWVSDHVCWTGVMGLNTHDLLPLPFNEDTLKYVVQRVRQVQEVLERPLILENPSSYVTFQASTMAEWEFLSRLAEEADCGLLVDVNNVYVSARNHDFDPREYLAHIPPHRVVQIHLAGHTDLGDMVIDTHDQPVVHEVWKLYREFWQSLVRAHQAWAAQEMGLPAACDHRLGVATLIEWDAHIPPLERLLAEVDRARRWTLREDDVSAEGWAQSVYDVLPQPAVWVPAEVE